LAWAKYVDSPECATLEARAQLLMFFIRRFCIGTATKPPLDERTLLGRFAHALELADTPGIKRKFLQRAFDDLLALLQDEAPKDTTA